MCRSNYQNIIFLIHDCLLTQHVLEPSVHVLYIVLPPQNGLVNNVKVHEYLGLHKHIHFNIKVKSVSKY